MSNRRHTTRLASLASIAVSSLFASLALAQSCGIYLYEIDKNVSYTQTSDLAPTDPDAWYFHAGIFFDQPDAVTSASLSFLHPPIISTDIASAGPMTRQTYSGFYNSRTEMDADYPATSYTFTADCASGSHSAAVSMPIDLFCAETPYFTGTTYDRLQVYDPTRDFVGDINAFVPHPDSNAAVTSIAISQDMVGGVFSITLAPGDTQFSVPANTLQPGARHLISVSYTCLIQIRNAGFEGATAEAAFSRGTAIAFATLPTPPACPADLDDGTNTGTPDGGVTIDDLLYYLDQFAQGSTRADLDDGSGNGTPDGGVTIDDLLYFLEHFAAGC